MGLVQATDGNLYGTTQASGGTIFKITPSGTLTSLFAFNGLNNNSASPAEPIQGTDGNFYGTTYDGGTGTACNGGVCGTVFKLTPGGTLTTLHSFHFTDGSFPLAGLIRGVRRYEPIRQSTAWLRQVGAAVKILGTHLTGATSVDFNGRTAKFTVVSSSEITATVPSGATTGEVKVVTPSSPLLNNVSFRVP